MKIFLGHGTSDTSVPFSLAKSTNNILKHLQHTVEFKSYRCLAHACSDVVGIYFISFCRFFISKFFKFPSNMAQIFFHIFLISVNLLLLLQTTFPCRKLASTLSSVFLRRTFGKVQWYHMYTISSDLPSMSFVVSQWNICQQVGLPVLRKKSRIFQHIVHISSTAVFFS